MKVKIIKSRLDTYWYADRIGEVFEVVETDHKECKTDYVLADPTEHGLFYGAISPDDCEIIPSA